MGLKSEELRNHKLFSNAAVQDNISSLTYEQTSYTKGRQVIECLPRVMNKNKKIRVHYGRVNRVVKLDSNVHKSLKELAKKRLLSISELYDQLVRDFLEETKNPGSQTQYLFHQNDAKKISIYLREKTVNAVKERAVRDLTTENRIVFTAVTKFAEKNNLLTV